MRFKKEYGQSKENVCQFCGKTAFIKNAQGLSVCEQHKKNSLELRCFCGLPVDVRDGKYGAFAVCQQCGIQKIHRLLEVQPEEKKQSKKQATPVKPAKKNVHDMSDDDALYACFH